MSRKLAKGRWPDAERAAEHCLVHEFACVVCRRMKRPAGGGAQQSPDGKKTWGAWGGKVDIFNCDVVGKMADGAHVYAQVTCGQSEAVRQRRRKLEKIPWHETDTVLVLQMVEAENPAHRARKVFSFRVHELVEGKWRVQPDAVTIPRAWFKAFKEDDFPDWKNPAPALF